MTASAATVTGSPPRGEVLSVNVGMPEDVAWRRKTIRTAIAKRPVAGRGRLRRLNLDGDGQADLVGHGGDTGRCCSTSAPRTGTGRGSSDATT